MIHQRCDAGDDAAEHCCSAGLAECAVVTRWFDDSIHLIGVLRPDVGLVIIVRRIPR